MAIKDAFIAELKHESSLTRKILEKVPLDKKDWKPHEKSMKRGEHLLLSTTKKVAIRGWAFSHMIHHRGQLSVYLRLLDVPVPGMYGPSADEQ